MTTFVFDVLANGTTVTFGNPSVDVLQFNSASAADVVVSAIDADTTTFTVGGKMVTVNGLATRQIATADPVHNNVLFSNGSVLFVGDGLVDQFGDQNGNILNGTAGNDQLLGLEGDDDLRPGAGNDRLNGGAGNDTLAGGLGNDTMDGGAGVDTVTYAASTARVTVNLGTGGASGEGFDTLTNIENVVGTNLDDNFFPNAQNNVLDGGAGSDTVRFDDATQGVTSGVTVDLSMAVPQNIGGGMGTDTLISIENVTGSPFDDTFFGNADTNVFRGGAGGFDTVSYANAPGPITLAVGNFITVTGGPGIGTDSLDNFNTIDALIGSSFDDHLTGFRIPGVLEGGPGNDTITGNVALDIASYAHAPNPVTVSLALSGAPQNTVSAGLDTLVAVDGLLGSAFDDTLTGDANNNVLEGGAGNDTLNGGAGLDAASYVTAAAAVTVNLGLTGAQNTASAGLDTLSNMEGLVGSKFDDTLTGNAAANVIEGGLGNDVMNAGAGVDTASYATATAGVTVDLTLTTAQNTGGAGTDTLSNFENLIGSGFADTLTGNAGNNVIDGGNGTDTLNGGAGVDTVSYATLSFGGTVSLATGKGIGGDNLSNFENIIGSPSNDTLTGDAGNNVIEGGAGNDVMDGGGGVDTASYSSAGASVTVTLANPGVQQNTGGAGSDTLSGFENLTGSNFNDALTGDAQNNVLEGGAGDDTLNGAGGTDTVSYAGAGAGVTVTLDLNGVQQNTVGAGLDTLTAIESLLGSAFNDVLTGNSGANALAGGGGNDVLEGGAGNDVLNGGAGTDTASYAGATLGVTVNLATAVAQNTVGAGSDTLLGIENLAGSGVNDTLTGDAQNNVLEGGAGNDTLNGAPD